MHVIFYLFRAPIDFSKFIVGTMFSIVACGCYSV